jgi:hypothetical protein
MDGKIVVLAGATLALLWIVRNKPVYRILAPVLPLAERPVETAAAKDVITASLAQNLPSTAIMNEINGVVVPGIGIKDATGEILVQVN